MREHHHISIVDHSVLDGDLERRSVADLAIPWVASSGSLTWHQHTLSMRGCLTTEGKNKQTNKKMMNCGPASHYPAALGGPSPSVESGIRFSRPFFY